MRHIPHLMAVVNCGEEAPEVKFSLLLGQSRLCVLDQICEGAPFVAIGNDVDSATLWVVYHLSQLNNVSVAHFSQAIQLLLGLGV